MNPWLGGISASVQGISSLSLQEEERAAEFISLTDNRGNVWSGIALRTSIAKHEKHRGIELCRTIDSFFRPGHSLREGWMEANDKLRYRCGKVATGISSEGIIRLGSDKRTAILHAVNQYPGSNALLYTKNQLIHHRATQGSSVDEGETVWSAPVFFVFANEPLTYTELRALAEIRFDHSRG